MEFIEALVEALPKHVSIIKRVEGKEKQWSRLGVSRFRRIIGSRWQVYYHLDSECLFVDLNTEIPDIL